MDTEYSKRVYQGVRVKHTVKDLLAEKRSRQTNGPRYSSGSTTPPSLVQMSGSHMLPSYYGMRRPFISDSDFASSTKQFSSDVYPSTYGGRTLSCETSSFSLIDTYYPDTFSEYRNTTANFSSSGGSFLPSAALSSLLPPPFSGESSHVYMRDSWEQSVPEPVPQVEPLCPDNLASVPSSMPSPDSQGSPSQPSQGSSIGLASSSQSYTLHSLEDANYHLLTSNNSYAAPPSSFLCPPYINTDLMSKIVTEEAVDSHSSLPLNLEAHTSWDKEDNVSGWSPYELRRAY
ncbi:POU class 2 homeobox associating-factor 2-like [Corythoichthys intestinalis]|uniref:POU class 2 homeobox associating-factor 2-like n=1 Tax=Corythoichthys intestinalis TaxID=161448 RepID=UPI0025A5BC17|nr:POU class 2 homeobox associating-factor 2-like [Corythoichthys intestinalis]